MTKETISQSANIESFRAKIKTHQYASQCWQCFILFLTVCVSHVKCRKGRHFWCEGCRFGCFETGLGEVHADPESPERFQKYHNCLFYPPRTANDIHLPNQRRKVKRYVNPCLDFLGIPDQRTAYAKRQVRPGWTYVRRSMSPPTCL